MAKTPAKTPAAPSGKTVETVTRTREVVEDPRAEIGLDGGGDELDAVDPLAKLDEIGVDGGAKYRVHRTSPTGFDGYIGTYTREELEPDAIFAEWGGGRFRITVVDAAGKVRGNAILMIAGRPKHKADPAQSPTAMTPAAGLGSEMARVLEGIQASQAAAQKATGDQIGLLTTLITSLINREPPKAPPAPDQFALIEKLAPILKPQDNSGKAVEMLLQGIELANRFGGGGHEPGMADVFLEGFRTIKDAAKLAPNAHQPRPAQRRIAPQPQGVAAAPGEAPPAATPPTEAQKQDRWIKQQVEFLVVQASRAKDPELYAELFLDNLPPFLPEAEAKRRMSDEAELTKLAEAVPAVMNYLPWFEKFRDAVLAFIDQGARQSADPGVIDHDAAGDDNAPGE